MKAVVLLGIPAVMMEQDVVRRGPNAVMLGYVVLLGISAVMVDYVVRRRPHAVILEAIVVLVTTPDEDLSLWILLYLDRPSPILKPVCELWTEMADERV
jgi:hypothetical protein